MQRYFNAGVLVIDLPKWRSKRVGESALQCLQRHGSEIIFWDQDASGAVLVDNWLETNPRCNRTSNYWAYLEKGAILFSRDVVEGLANPAIVHFASGRKPWIDWRYPDRAGFDRFVTLAGFGEQRMTMLRAAKGLVWKAMTRDTLLGFFRRFKRWLGVGVAAP